MNLSYYDATKFPLLLDMFKQSCEQAILLKAEYTKNGDANTLERLRLSDSNSVKYITKSFQCLTRKRG